MFDIMYWDAIYMTAVKRRAVQQKQGFSQRDNSCLTSDSCTECLPPLLDLVD